MLLPYPPPHLPTHTPTTPPHHSHCVKRQCNEIRNRKLTCWVSTSTSCESAASLRFMAHRESSTLSPAGLSLFRDLRATPSLSAAVAPPDFPPAWCHTLFRPGDCIMCCFEMTPTASWETDEGRIGHCKDDSPTLPLACHLSLTHFPHLLDCEHFSAW